MQEHLITEEMLADIDAIYQQRFKKEAYFEWPMLLHEIIEHADFDTSMMPVLQQREPRPQKPFAALIAEMHIAHHLGWHAPIVAPAKTQTEQLLQFVTKAASIQNKSVWLYTTPIHAAALDAFRPYLQGVASLLGTVNRDIYHHMFPNIPFTEHLAMFDDATKCKKGAAILLGIGESLHDIKTLKEFIASNHLNRIIFIPVTPSRYTTYTRPPTSFVVARWIAETRIAHPDMEIVAGTTADRAAEVSLFLRAGANAITKFPAIKLFNTDAARIIEMEVKNAGREFTSTLTNAHRLKSMRQMLTKAHEPTAVKMRAEKFMEAMQSLRPPE